MASAPPLTRASRAAPPQLWFGVSAIFHYLGPSFAVLLFPAVGVLGVAWLRIVTAAIVFVPWTRPWWVIRSADRRTRLLLALLGVSLAVMNISFYEALDRLPISLVSAMEFLGTISVALYGVRTFRNAAALAIAVGGVATMADVTWNGDPAGLLWSALNSALFVVYVLIGHAIAGDGASRGVERLGTAMSVAALVVIPVGSAQVLAVFGRPWLIAAGIGVGVCSSVIPYVCDQLAMSRLSRSSFALLLALLPAMATVVGLVVLRQIPTPQELAGLALVCCGILLHRPTARDGMPPTSRDGADRSRPASPGGADRTRPARRSARPREDPPTRARPDSPAGGGPRR